ncbi:MAG: transglycosylase SLT domain-containing protein [Candidatus Poribacteria bacterium]|nr:transglycosylase SLT domain-containing protein [Candidatus Poribacteria bacterium]
MIRKRTVLIIITTVVLIFLISGLINGFPPDVRLLALTPKILQYRGLIQKYAAKEDLDARFICALITQESGFNEKAESPVGALGLTQLMPNTAKELGVEDPFDAEQNVAGATRYLNTLYRAFPDSPDEDRHRLVLASYNGGLGRVRDAQALIRHSKMANPTLWGPVSIALSQLTRAHADIHREVWESGEPPHGYFQGSDKTLYFVERVMHYYDRIQLYGGFLFFL